MPDERPALQAKLNEQVQAAAQAVLDRQTEPAPEAAPAVGETAAAETPAPPAATPAVPEAVEAPALSSETVVPPAEAPSGTAEEDVPTTYYGVELPGTAEERQAVITALSGRDQHIQKLLRDKAEQAKVEETAPAAPAAPAAPEPPAEVSNEDILTSLGLNPEHEDLDDPKVQAIIGLARFSLGLQSEVGELKQGFSVRETAVLWETQLDALEAEYGTLPEGITRDDVLEHAVRAGIAEPVDAYWRIMGPARAEVMAAVKARRDAAATALKRGSSPVKPRSEAELAPAPLEAKNTKDAVKEVMLRLEKSGRFNFGRE